MGRARARERGKGESGRGGRGEQKEEAGDFGEGGERCGRCHHSLLPLLSHFYYTLLLVLFTTVLCQSPKYRICCIRSPQSPPSRVPPAHPLHHLQLPLNALQHVYQLPDVLLELMPVCAAQHLSSLVEQSLRVAEEDAVVLVREDPVRSPRRCKCPVHVPDPKVSPRVSCPCGR